MAPYPIGNLHLLNRNPLQTPAFFAYRPSRSIGSQPSAFRSTRIAQSAWRRKHTAMRYALCALRFPHCLLPAASCLLPPAPCAMPFALCALPAASAKGTEFACLVRTLAVNNPALGDLPSVFDSAPRSEKTRTPTGWRASGRFRQRLAAS